MGQWNEAKIGEIAEVKGGKRIPKGRKLIKEPNSHPYIRIRNLGKTKYLQIGDKIKLTNLKNETIEYEIFKIYSIDPDDVSCVESVENGTREITLITCTNGHKNRLVTKARQIKIWG